MKILYFAWLRERVGTAEEDIVPPAEIATVGALTDWLANRSPGHASALAERRAIRVAVDRTFAPAEQPIAGAGEIAYFPPFTGG